MGFRAEARDPVLLRTLIEEACNTKPPRSEKTETAEQLRRERDEMLQYLLQAVKLQGTTGPHQLPGA
jgi:hypothetical protein